MKESIIENFKSYFFWIIIAILYGFVIAHFTVNLIKFSYNKIKGPEIVVLDKQATDVIVATQKNVIKEPRKISMVFVGNIMLDRGVEWATKKYGKGDFEFPFLKIADDLKRADVLFGNLEGPISDKGKEIGNLHSFRMSTSSAEALSNAGFNVLSIANNHIGDWGREAFEDTIFRLKNKGILVVGGGLDRNDAEEVKIFEKNGFKIGFLGFSDVGPNWLKAEDNLSGVRVVDDSFKDIIHEASQKVDCLVVSLHFGEEYQKEPNKKQKEIARSVIDNGAKIVVGHHSHVIQDKENYKDGLIVYSLGNFIFDQSFSEETMRGLVLEIVLKEKGIVESNEKIVKINNFFQPVLEFIDKY